MPGAGHNIHLFLCPYAETETQYSPGCLFQLHLESFIGRCSIIYKQFSAYIKIGIALHNNALSILAQTGNKVKQISGKGGYYVRRRA